MPGDDRSQERAEFAATAAIGVVDRFTVRVVQVGRDRACPHYCRRVETQVLTAWNSDLDFGVDQRADPMRVEVHDLLLDCERILNASIL